MATSSRPRGYPPPLVIPPMLVHETTMIVLHGRGSTAEKFANPLLSHLVSSPAPSSVLSVQSKSIPSTFQSHFPNTKFIFPTASLRRAQAYNRSMTHQWFDMYPLDEYPVEHKAHIQQRGLRESGQYIMDLAKEAAKEVGRGKVIVMGLSQGCATLLTAILAGLMDCNDGRHGDETGTGGVVGMCGWLPFKDTIAQAVGGCDELFEEGANDIFDRDVTAQEEEDSKVNTATTLLREELGLESLALSPMQTSSLCRVPIFFGHGTLDEKVPFQLGRQSAEVLQSLGLNVTWRDFEGLGHWYSADMLRDVVAFIQGLEGWQRRNAGLNQFGAESEQAQI
ncbi:alpha/beta-hydrolase [Polyplosphaeria fusca]|uniref:Alpha/beta-hydrolase n=1 Tax=Polyplosphaeria fusca TaxID=682080 RepID=A0A9P4R9L6_9PLEO|nr:alpha/beta-hydrolase [Polyplosphaeria fusca]